MERDRFLWSVVRRWFINWLESIKLSSPQKHGMLNKPSYWGAELVHVGKYLAATNNVTEALKCQKITRLFWWLSAAKLIILLRKWHCENDKNLKLMATNNETTKLLSFSSNIDEDVIAILFGNCWQINKRTLTWTQHKNFSEFHFSRRWDFWSWTKRAFY